MLGLLLGMIWWFGYRDTPAAHPLITKEEVEYITAGQPPERAAAKGALQRCLRQSRFWIFGVQYFLLVLIQSFYTTWLPTYLMRARGLSLKAMGFYASLPWIAVFVAVFVAGVFSDWLLRKTGSIYWARTPVAMTGFVVSALALTAASRAESIAVVIGLLCLSFAAVGFVQVVVWSATQDLGRAFAGVMSGWTNVWGALSNVAGPMTLALIVKVTHSWGSGMIVIGAAAGCGALLWLFVRPERPLLNDDVAEPPACAEPATSHHDGRESRTDAGQVSEQNG
jgi:MFS transporter, ACS family, glucarate transporter